MFSTKINTQSFKLHNDESGQTALETAIILIAFVVVASVFAFTILSAGQASTDKGEKAIYAGLQGVESSMAVKGAVIGKGATNKLTDIVFDVALASGGDPVDLSATSPVTIAYRDSTQTVSPVKYVVSWPYKNTNAATATLLEQGELAEITITLADTAAITAPGANTNFTLEVKPPTGAILNITRTIPAAIDAVMELR